MFALDASQFEGREDFIADMTIFMGLVQRLQQYSINKNAVEYKTLCDQQEALEEKATKVILKYKEEWRLVIKLVPLIISTSLEALDRLDPLDAPFELMLSLLKNVAECIGIKRIGRYWPTEVIWLPKLIHWTELYIDKTLDRYNSIYLLVLWLASAVKTPFALAKFDVKEQAPTAQRVVNILPKMIPLSCRCTNLLVANLYARPDLNEQTDLLASFIEHLESNYKDVNNPDKYKVSCLQAMAALLKSVNRNVMKQYVDSMVQLASSSIQGVGADHELVSKFCVKILGRSAMCLLKPKVFKHRYDLGHRIACVNGDGDKMENSQSQQNVEEDDEDIDENGMEFFQDIVQQLLSLLSHKSSMLRNSVSKYLASICGRLPAQMSLDLLDYISNQECTDMASDTAWHGSCLTLARLVARRLIALDRLGEVIELAKKALFYDHLKGSFSIGSHVRDAAAYICFSLPRAYRDTEIEAFVLQLAPALLCMACFDRELNCRRAGSAVIQEWTGRTGGKFPHWQEVIEKTEFLALSKLENAFLVCGVAFSAPGYEIFHQAIVQHLLGKAQTHWDVCVRRLAAKALGGVADQGLKLEQFQDDWNKLVPHKESKLFYSLSWTHGTILAWSFIIENDQNILDRCPRLMTVIEDLLDKLKSCGLFHGVGGDLVRESLLRLFGVLFATKRAVKCGEQWRQFVFETMEGFVVENDIVQEGVVDTCHILLDCAQIDEKMDIFTKLEMIVKRGQAAPVATVCKIVYRTHLELLDPARLLGMLQTITSYMSCTMNEANRCSETLSEAVKAMVKLCSHTHNIMQANERKQVFDLYECCLCDHTVVKSKGSVGLPVRLASIQVVPDYVDHLDEQQRLRVFQLVAAEAMFYRNGSFGHAFKTLVLMADKVKQLDALTSNALRETPAVNMDKNSIPDCDTLKPYELVVSLLDNEHLTWHLLPGLACVLEDPVIKKHARIILEHVNRTSDANRIRIVDALLRFYRQNARDARLSLPLMACIKELLLNVSLEDVDNAYEKIAEVSWGACRGTNNPRKYMLCVDILTSLATLNVSNNLKMAYRYLDVFLAHRTPKVRHYTALEMFAMLMAIDDGGEALAEACRLLQLTDWIAIDLDDARSVRNQVRTFIDQLVEA